MAMDVSPVKEEASAYKVPGEKLMTCASNPVDEPIDLEAVSNKNAVTLSQTAEVGINMTECTNSGEEGIVGRGYHEATESSSSFGDTDPGTSSDAVLGDAEVESRWKDDDASMFSFDDFGDLFRMRKKKLTTHWRKFIRPLMWRCKWLELHIRELQSQASNYDKELAACEQRKQHDFQRFTGEDLHVKSVPTLGLSQRVNVMRRKKRRRVEETVDLPSYMAEHHVFSYYVNKRSFADDIYVDEDHSPLATVVNSSHVKADGANGEWVPLRFNDGDSFEDMLQKILGAQAQVSQLRDRMQGVLRECTEKFASSDSLHSLPARDPLSSSAAHLEARGMDGQVRGGYHPTTLFPSPEQKALGQVMPDRVVSSHGEVVLPPDMIVEVHHPLTGLSQQKIEQPALVYKRSVKRELHGFEEPRLQQVHMGQPQPSNDQQQQAGSFDPLPGTKHESPDNTVVADKQPTSKPRPKPVTPKSKKKRGKRKAALNRWNKKSSG